MEIPLFAGKKQKRGKTCVIPSYSTGMWGKLPVACHRTELFTESLLSTFCKLLYQENMCGELNIYEDVVCSVRSRSRHTKLRQEEFAFLEELPKKGQSGGCLIRTLLFSPCPLVPLCVGGMEPLIQYFDSVLNTCHVMK